MSSYLPNSLIVDIVSLKYKLLRPFASYMFFFVLEVAIAVKGSSGQ